METVQSLRENGYKVFVKHLRRYKSVGYNKGAPFIFDAFGTKHEIPVGVKMLATGGVTTVEVITPSGDSYNAVAQCHNNDAFEKKQGCRLALERALRQIF